MMINFKKIIFVFILFLMNESINAQNEFISIWQSTNANPTIEIPTYDGEIYNYTVNWGDGSVSNNVVGDITHNYAVTGNYIVTITGVFPGINFKKIEDRELARHNRTQILSIQQWGNNQWKSMDGAFSGQFNLVINSTDIPDLSQCTSMKEMFRTCVAIDNGTHNKWNLWNTATITDMSGLFYQNNFNKSIENWNTTNVTNMFEMFFASDFNQDISGWNVSNVTNMSRMFVNADFNVSIDNWNTGNVTNMSEMFKLSSYNKPLNNWNVSKVTNMSGMFYRNLVFNQPLDNWIVSNVITMQEMFREAISFNQPLNSWNVSKVTNMNYMFGGKNADDTIFNQPLHNWVVSSVSDMGNMFIENRFFNQDIGNWNVSNVTNMQNMFRETQNFNQNISNWVVSKVTNMSAMFYQNPVFNQPINNWDVSKVTDMYRMFAVSNFNQDISNWDVSSLINMANMFNGADFFNQNIGNWDTANVTNMESVFSTAIAFDQDLSNWDVSKVTNMATMFQNITLSPANYDAILIAWNAQNLRQNVTFHGGNSKYSSNDAEAARQNMIANDNWTITDGGKLQAFVWTGTISTDWNTSGNWNTNSVPTQNDDVILADVANAPRVNFNQSHAVKDLTTHKALTIKNNASLTVNGNLDQRATIQIESFVNGNGSFILRGNQLNLNPPNITYLRYISGNNWHLIGSPVLEMDIDILAAATQLAEGQNDNRGIGFYDNNANPKWSYYQDEAENTGNFVAGKGYSINTAANAFLNFTGKLKANNLSNYAITENLNGWNLVGNPYPAFININTDAAENDNFLNENVAALDPEFANVYLWNPSTDSYEPTGNGLGAKYIAPAQGFFVKSKNGGGIIDIKKSLLNHQTGNLFLKNNQPQKIVLKIDDKTNISETTIAFKNGMTKGLDITFDAAVFSGESKKLSLFTKLLENDKNIPFAIQFLPELENNSFIIPLGIAQKEDSEIIFSLKETTISSDVKIFLEDKVLETFTEITSNSDYKFFLDKENSEVGRFFLHVQNSALNIKQIEKPSVHIYKDKNATIHINGISDGLLNIYTITGKNIINNFKIDADKKQIKLNNLSKGIYLFKIKKDEEYFIKKIIF